MNALSCKQRLKGWPELQSMDSEESMDCKVIMDSEWSRDSEVTIDSEETMDSKQFTFSEEDELPELDMNSTVLDVAKVFYSMVLHFRRQRQERAALETPMTQNVEPNLDSPPEPNLDSPPDPSQHKPNKKHRCSECNKSYKRRNHLVDHMRIHTGERPYECTHDDCTKAFARSDELARHIRTHTGEKRHICTICKKTFGRPDHLKKHIQIHSRVRSQNSTRSHQHETHSTSVDQNAVPAARTVSKTQSKRRVSTTDQTWRLSGLSCAEQLATGRSAAFSNNRCQ